jgi:DNA-binding MarR family transcriptional regulator
MKSEKDTPLGIIEHEISLLVRRAQSADLKTGKLDRSAYLLLGELDENGPRTISALAEKFQLDISTISRQTAALEAKELVERLTDPADARVSLLQITQLGHSLFHEVRQARLDRYAKLFKDWSPEELRQFGEFLMRLNRASQQANS